MRLPFFHATLVLLAVGSAAPAQPKLDFPAELRPVGQYVRFLPKTDAKAISYVGLSGLDPFPSEELKDPRTFLLPVNGLPAGRYHFAAVGTLADKLARMDFIVVVGDPGPKPPGPDPKPPDPKPPTPSPAPIPDPGFRVLIIWETGESLTPGHSSVIGSVAVRGYLDRKCVPRTLNGQTWPEYRLWDKDAFKDVPLANETELWQKAHARAVQKSNGVRPWLLVSNGTDGFEGPLPATVAETLALLKKYGGE